MCVCVQFRRGAFLPSKKKKGRFSLQNKQKTGFFSNWIDVCGLERARPHAERTVVHVQQEASHAERGSGDASGLYGSKLSSETGFARARRLPTQKKSLLCAGTMADYHHTRDTCQAFTKAFAFQGKNSIEQVPLSEDIYYPYKT